MFAFVKTLTYLNHWLCHTAAPVVCAVSELHVADSTKSMLCLAEVSHSSNRNDVTVYYILILGKLRNERHFFIFLIILKSSFQKVMVTFCSLTQNIVPFILLVNLLKIRASMVSIKNYMTLIIFATHFPVLLIGVLPEFSS